MDKNPHKKYAEYSVRNNNPNHYIIKADRLSHVFLQGDPSVSLSTFEDEISNLP